MNGYPYNRSAEVVLHQRRESRQGAECLEKCLKQLTPRQRTLLFQFYGSKQTRTGVSATLGLSHAQMKKSALKIKKCMRECLEKAEENDFPV